MNRQRAPGRVSVQIHAEGVAEGSGEQQIVPVSFVAGAVAAEPRLGERLGIMLVTRHARFAQEPFVDAIRISLNRLEGYARDGRIGLYMEYAGDSLYTGYLEGSLQIVSVSLAYPMVMPE
jgi:hypothetical protein